MRPFFYPKAIAVVGVSREAWKFGSVTYLSLKHFAQKVSVYPVSSRLTELNGEKVYPSISDLPDDVDLVVICLPAPLAIDTVRQCIQKRIPAVIISSGGFREIGTDEGRALEAELGKLKDQGTRIIGPNCFGVYSPAGGVTILPGVNYSHIKGSVGFFAQSGGITEDFCDLSREYGFYISQAISYGNAVDVNELDLATFFYIDEDTKIVASYLEGVNSGKDFFHIIKKLAQSKPTIILKGGLTPTGSRAAKSHTGSLAGDDKIWRAFFKQTGAIQALSMQELLDTVAAFYHLPKTTDERVAILCGGGGVSVVASDSCYRAGLTLPAFKDETLKRLKSVLPPPGSSAHNPVDCDNPFPKAEILRDVMEIIVDSKEVGSIIIDKIALSKEMRQLLGYTRQVGWEEPSWLKEIPVNIRKQYKIPVIVVLREGGEGLDNLSVEAERRRLRKYFQGNGVAVFPNIQRALGALGKMVNYYKQLEAL